MWEKAALDMLLLRLQLFTCCCLPGSSPDSAGWAPAEHCWCTAVDAVPSFLGSPDYV